VAWRCDGRRGDAHPLNRLGRHDRPQADGCLCKDGALGGRAISRLCKDGALGGRAISRPTLTDIVAPQEPADGGAGMVTAADLAIAPSRARKDWHSGANGAVLSLFSVAISLVTQRSSGQFQERTGCP
jgi:hypothetical protein